MNFPCQFTIKVFGSVETELELLIIETVRKHQITIELAQITRRASSGGKYLAYSASFQVDNQVQLDNIYRDLSAHPQIIMVI
jgi:putative lipoic acid-binding regulatory protein